MALTVSALITAAKRVTFGVTGRQKVPNATLIEELNHQENLVVQLLSQISPDLLSNITGSEVVTLAKNQSGGYSLTPGIAYRDFTHVDGATDVYIPIKVIQRQFQDKRVIHPAITISTGADAALIYPVDPDGNRWQVAGTRIWFEDTSTHTIEYSYVPPPKVATALSDTFTSPDMARQVFVSSLELSIILMSPEAPDRRIAAASKKYEDSLERLRWQAHKFVHPQGSHGVSDLPMGESEWINNQIAG